MSQGPSKTGAVAEVQGLYGPFTFPEKLLQKIWQRGDFERRATRTNDGRVVEVVHPGRWNSLGGPDFKNARLRFGFETEITGDVELHLHASDWAAHRHASDRAYDGVRLHVVLFPPPPGHVTRGAGGVEIPVLALLPLLLHDLEEYAAEDAVERLANRPATMIVEILGAMAPAEIRELLVRHAAERWRQKVHFARLRIQRLGWDDACHHTALEILGYRYNRAPMLRVAGARSLGDWAAPTMSADEVFESERAAWSLQGLRPANHPRVRLAQYATWVRARPDWPERLGRFGGRVAATAPRLAADAAGEAGKLPTTRQARLAGRFAELRKDLASDICAETVGGTRCNNLICDGFLPLLSAREGGDAGYLVWFHWWPGDLPPLLPDALRQLGVFGGKDAPACHGGGQGLLGWLLDREREQASSSSET